MIAYIINYWSVTPPAEIFCQTWIVVFGLSTAWFMSRLEHWRRWGFVLGMIGQPAWWYTTYTHDQIGIAILSLGYTYSWVKGFYNYWVLGENIDNKSAK